MRKQASQLGQHLIDRHLVQATQDIFYLTLDELTLAIMPQSPSVDLLALVATRKDLREQQKRGHPPARVPEDLRFKFGPFDLTRMFAV